MPPDSPAKTRSYIWGGRGGAGAITKPLGFDHDPTGPLTNYSYNRQLSNNIHLPDMVFISQVLSGHTCVRVSFLRSFVQKIPQPLLC